jgi:hypothetical protein
LVGGGVKILEKGTRENQPRPKKSRDQGTQLSGKRACMPRDFRLPGMFQNLKEAKVLGEE